MKRTIAAVTALLLGVTLAQAQTYPTRPIQVIVPFAGGSASDVVMRVLLERMGVALGHRFIVDNRPGAALVAANKTLYKDLGYDPEHDLAPIALFATLPNVIVVSKTLPIANLKEFIAYAKAHPKELNYGSVGIGSSQHLAGAHFEQVAGVEMTHVPYRNIAQYVPDLIAGSVQTGFQFLPNVITPLKTGDAIALAVTSPTRMSALPDVPTAKEAGLDGYETYGWLALLAPKDTPRPIIDRLHTELAAAIKDETVKARFLDLGAEPVAISPEETSKFISAELKKWREIITKAGITVTQ
jgi:tripartite-type tricarboxylate transporter receptor subunit TctC